MHLQGVLGDKKQASIGKALQFLVCLQEQVKTLGIDMPGA